MPLTEDEIALPKLPKQRCVKCGNTEDFNCLYIDWELESDIPFGRVRKTVAIEPHLRFTCKFCQHYWEVKPLDKEKK